MPIAIYDAAVPPLLRGLAALSAILSKGERWAEANGKSPSELIEARLAPDMFPLARQVQVVSDTAKGCAARLTQETPPSWPDEEKSFDELRERLARTIAYIEARERAAFEGAEDRTVVMKFPGRELSFTGRDYLSGFVLPNFYFHLTAAYAILRNQGVDVGKMDYLGAS